MGYKAGFNEKELLIELTDKFSVYDVLSLKNAILDKIDESKLVKIDYLNIESIDTAGVQLLISIVKTCRNKEIELIFNGNSVINEYSNLLGRNLVKFLNLDEGAKSNV